MEPVTSRRSWLPGKRPHIGQLRRPEKGPASLALKNHFVAMIGEYVGTVLFMIFALGGTNVANIPTTSVTGATTAGQDGSTASTANTSNLLYIALSFGFSLTVNAWIFFRVSGGLFNPAVSLGMALVGALTPLRACLLSLSQTLGGITGAAIIQAITPGTLNVRTQLGGGTSVAQGLFIEMFLTSLLMLAILLLAAEKHKATFIAPIGIGLSLFVAELLGVYYTGGSLNPARSFGPSVVLSSFDSYHWIYWLGPCMGASLAAGFYKLLKWLQYETVLGPEEADEPPRPSAGDLEKGEGRRVEGQETGSKGGKMAVTGPGISDLLTAGDSSAVFDLNHRRSDNEDRMARMEDLLHELLERGNGRSGRFLQQTAVNDQVTDGALAGHALKPTTGVLKPVPNGIDSNGDPFQSGRHTDSLAHATGTGVGRNPAVGVLSREGVPAGSNKPYQQETQSSLGNK